MGSDGGGLAPALDRFVIETVGHDLAAEEMLGRPTAIAHSAPEVAEMLETSTLMAIWEGTARQGAGWHDVCAMELGTRGIDVGT